MTIEHATDGTQLGPVGYQDHDAVAVLRIDNPPINASTDRVRAGIIDGISRAATDPEIYAVVLIGTGRAFVSGSDLTEFDEVALPEPQLPEVIAAIESCPKPVVAALSGAALGGGLELALGCDARVAAPETIVGLPEATLGMIPGAGGTQRLPRLVGIASAIDLVCSGRRISAQAARDYGIVDALSGGVDDLLSVAVGYAREQAGKRVLSNLPVPSDAVGAIERAAASALKRQGASAEVVAAIGTCLLAGVVPAADALAYERSEFTRLRLSDEARALRHLFFAERAAGREARGGDGKMVDIAGVIGAGTMGTGITRALLDAGIKVTLVESNADVLVAARNRLSAGYSREVERGRISEHDAAVRLAGLTATTQYADLASADVVIEAVFEDMDVKKQVLGVVDEIVRPEAVVASNTSYLDLDEIAMCTKYPERIVGMHFFSPAHATRIVEVVRGAASDPNAVALAVGVTKRIRKIPVVSGVGFGFIGNRIYNAYRQQCELMLEEGATPDQVDKALEAYGFSMGPFRVSDMSGLDIAWRMRRNTNAKLDTSVRYVDIADKLCEQGRFGQKAGRGWYRYESNSTVPQPDLAVVALIEAESGRKGISRRAFTDSEIVHRVLLAMANSAALLIEEGIAARPSDIDIMMTAAYGFPRRCGGPAFWARLQDATSLKSEFEMLRTLTGNGYAVGNPEFLAAVRQ